MFAIEFTSNRPSGSAPYYSLVIREDPYMVGCLPLSDVCLPCHDVSPQHAMLQVMREHTAARIVAAGGVHDDVHSEHNFGDAALEEFPVHGARPSGQGRASGLEEDEDPNVAAAAAAAAAAKDGGYSNESEEVSVASGGGTALVHAPAHGNGSDEKNGNAAAPLLEEDPLVVRLTALVTKGEGAIIVDGHELAAGESVILQNGAEVSFSADATVIFRFRPLVVSIESTAFTREYTRDLVYMFRRLGATLCNVAGGPTPNLQNIPTPIGLLHCTEELNASRGCVVALACGYSVVQPTYVFEWFASLAQTPSQPLSVLPAPSRFEVPVRATAHPRSAMYVRPESDTCPYSLYPIPSTAMRRRNRAELFVDKTFYLASQASADVFMETVAQCGGVAYGPNDVETVKLALRDMVNQQPNPNAYLAEVEEEHPYPTDFYVIVDDASEASMLNDGLRNADAALCRFMEEVNALGATHVPIMGDHSLFTSLLSNIFTYQPIQYSVDMPITTPVAASASGLQGVGANGAGGYQSHHIDDAVNDAAYPSMPSASNPGAAPVNRVGGAGGGSTAHSFARRRHSRSPRGHRASLLPRDQTRTPTRSQMRSASRQRASSNAVSASKADSQSRVADTFANTKNTLAGRAPSRGRRQLVPADYPSVAGCRSASKSPSLLTVGSRFDILRIRIYAFLVKEEPRLDTALNTYHRSHYVDDSVMERTLEVKAQAEEYMMLVDDLLDEGGYGPYADSLRRFWGDCSDLSAKAEQVIRAFDRQGRSRKPTTDKASSTYGSRHGSLSRSGNEIFDVDENGSPAAAGGTTGGASATGGAGSSSANGPSAGGMMIDVSAAAAGAGSPRGQTGGTGSRPHTPRVREHRDAYLSIGGQQRMSISASLSNSRGGLMASTGAVPSPRTTAAAAGTTDRPRLAATAPPQTSSAMGTQPDRASVGVGGDAPVSAVAGAATSLHEPDRYTDPNTNTNGGETATGAAVGSTVAYASHPHGIVQSNPQRRHSRPATSPRVVRANSRRRNEAPAGVSGSCGREEGAEVNRNGMRYEERVRRAPPPKPYAQRRMNAAQGKRAIEAERPAWQS